jgi:hypothetical protein
MDNLWHAHVTAERKLNKSKSERVLLVGPVPVRTQRDTYWQLVWRGGGRKEK